MNTELDLFENQLVGSALNRGLVSADTQAVAMKAPLIQATLSPTDSYRKKKKKKIAVEITNTNMG